MPCVHAFSVITTNEEKNFGVTPSFEDLYPYFLKLTKPEYWKRFLTGRSEYGSMLESLKGLFASGIERVRQRLLPVVAEQEQEFFETRFAPKHPEYAEHCTVHVLPLVNHMFAFPSWQEKMQSLVREWIGVRAS